MPNPITDPKRLLPKYHPSNDSNSMKTHRVFVYGSLMKGFPNHRFLRDSVLLGSFRTTNRFRMLSFGSFPGVSKAIAQGRDRPFVKCRANSKYRPVVGQIFLTSKQILEDLDELEQAYNREEHEFTSCENSSKKTKAFMYVLKDAERYVYHSDVLHNEKGDYCWSHFRERMSAFKN